MELIIRLFTMEDYDKVVKLWIDAGLPVRPLGRDSHEKIGEQIKNGNTIFLVAETEGAIAGSVLGTHDGRKGWINRLAVDSGFRRRQIASRLVKELETRFEQSGLDLTACLIEADNTISMKLFAELGYSEWSGKYYSKRRTRTTNAP
jgi:N-acetylglutamate synthase